MKKREQRQLKIAQAIESASKQDVVSSFDFIDNFERVVRLERKYNRLQELACNGYPMPVIEYRDGKTYKYNKCNHKLQQESEKQEERIEAKLKEIATKTGWFIRTQGDPRGATVQIDFFEQRKPNEQCSHTYLLYA